MTAATDAQAPGLRFEIRDARGVCVPAWNNFLKHHWEPGRWNILEMSDALCEFGASINWQDQSHLMFDSPDSLVEFVLVWS